LRSSRPAPTSEKRSNTEPVDVSHSPPPLAIMATKARAFRPISAWVTRGGTSSERAVMTGLLLAACFVHSGQWNPTDACTMQVGQIARPHRWHDTPARRSGCR
jgi:hypothetical protein